MKKYYDYMNNDTNVSNELLRKLFFILSVPDICAKQEITDKTQKSKRQKYIKWIENHKDCFHDIIESTELIDEFAKALWDLRCKVTHTGMFYDNKSKIYIIDEKQVGRNYKFGKWFICIDQLYDNIIRAVNKSDSIIINNAIIPDKIYKQLCQIKNGNEFNEMLENIETKMKQSRYH